MTLDIPRLSVLMLLPLLFFQMSAIAALDGAQRKSVYESTYKSCLVSSSKSAPHASQAEKHAWCTCYAGQVVDRVVPTDLKNFSPKYGPSAKMTSVANDAIAYCRNKLY